MGRIDYYNDPAAPAANSMMPAVSAVVVDDQGRIVLHRRADNGLWALPGGGMELGESITDAVIRVVFEETGFEVIPLYVIGVYSDPKHVFAYDNGEVRQEYSVCVACCLGASTLAIGEESVELDAFAPGDIDGLAMHDRIRIRINDFMAGERGAIR